jgi:hypothetical protein
MGLYALYLPQQIIQCRMRHVRTPEITGHKLCFLHVQTFHGVLVTYVHIFYFHEIVLSCVMDRTFIANRANMFYFYVTIVFVLYTVKNGER